MRTKLKNYTARLFFLSLLLTCAISPSFLTAQCMYYPISLEQRVEKASRIVLGHVTEQHCFVGPTGSINTLNIFQIDACLKNNTGAQKIAIITQGGVLNDRATIVTPALQLETYNEYILFLDGDNHLEDDKAYRALHPEMIQAVTYADGQGALTGQFGYYHDLLVEPKRNEAETFARIQSLTGQPVTTPEGDIFIPRVYEGLNNNKMMPITGFAPSPSNAGTIVPGEFLNITGSGFGAAAGTVFYTNADDGGATFTASGIASDNTAWADGAITNKIARRAGTGPININGAMTSGSNLTVNYSHIEVNANFSGFGSNTRQRYYHRNLNGAGGLYFLYNTTSGMSANAPAVAAFERALQTWRCATFINWFSNGTTATAVNGLDAVNVVLFDATLPAGVLGQAVSNFPASATGGCNLANTVWYLQDIDIRFTPNPPVAGFPWEFGPAAPAFTEYDFESVALHELGHAHGLGHVIAPTACMHFAIANGTSARTLNANDIAGGTARMTYSSAATCFNPVGSGTPMVLLTPITCVLPVTMIQFEGEQTDEGNQLSWNTVNEISNSGFTVQRSYNGILFESIAFVPGQSQDYNDYAFLDESAGNYPVFYYRLIQRDLNGAEKATEVVKILNQNSAPMLAVYPSVTADYFTVAGAELQSAAVWVSLTASDGREIFNRELDKAYPIVDITGLSAGVYFCRLTAGGSSVVYRVVKQD